MHKEEVEGATAPPRESVDCDVNRHGRALLDMCAATGLRIAKGRVAGDRPGQPTYVGFQRSQVVDDYFLCCLRLMAAAVSLHVTPMPPTAWCDHCVLRLDIALDAIPSSVDPRPLACLPAAPALPDYQVQARLLPAVHECMKVPEAQAELLAIRAAAEAAASPSEVEAAVDRLETLVCGAMEVAGMARRTGEGPQRSSPSRSTALVVLHRGDWAAVAMLDAFLPLWIPQCK